MTLSVIYYAPFLDNRRLFCGIGGIDCMYVAQQIVLFYFSTPLNTLELPDMMCEDQPRFNLYRYSHLKDGNHKEYVPGNDHLALNHPYPSYPNSLIFDH